MLFTELCSILVGAVVLVQGEATNSTAIQPNPSNGHWVDAWASMPQLTEPANLPPAPFVSILLLLPKGKSLTDFYRTKLELSLSTLLFVKRCS